MNSKSFCSRCGRLLPNHPAYWQGLTVCHFCWNDLREVWLKEKRNLKNKRKKQREEVIA